MRRHLKTLAVITSVVIVLVLAAAFWLSKKAKSASHPINISGTTSWIAGSAQSNINLQNADQAIELDKTPVTNHSDLEMKQAPSGEVYAIWDDQSLGTVFNKFTPDGVRLLNNDVLLTTDGWTTLIVNNDNTFYVAGNGGAHPSIYKFDANGTPISNFALANGWAILKDGVRIMNSRFVVAAALSGTYYVQNYALDGTLLSTVSLTSAVPGEPPSSTVVGFNPATNSIYSLGSNLVFQTGYEYWFEKRDIAGNLIWRNKFINQSFPGSDVFEIVRQVAYKLGFANGGVTFPHGVRYKNSTPTCPGASDCYRGVVTIFSDTDGHLVSGYTLPSDTTFYSNYNVYTDTADFDNSGNMYLATGVNGDATYPLYLRKYNGSGTMLWEIPITTSVQLPWVEISSDRVFLGFQAPYDWASPKAQIYYRAADFSGNLLYSGIQMLDTDPGNQYLSSGYHISGATQLDGTADFQHWDSFTPNEVDHNFGSGNVNTTITYAFRTSSDHATWGSWTAEQDFSGAAINLATLLSGDQKRYLEVRSTLATTNTAQTPKVLSYSASYTRNDLCDGFNHLTLTPSTTTINTGATSDFTALAINGGGSSMAGVTFNYSADSGTIDGSGHYTAPSIPGTYTITATSSCGGSVTASVTVVAPVVDTCENFDHVSISPKTATVDPGGTVTLTILSYNHDGSSNQSPATATSLDGSISESTFTAPTEPGTYTITANSSCGGSDTATITVTPKIPDYPCMFGFTLLNNTWVCADASLVSITVLKPNGGESYHIGDNLPINFKMPVFDFISRDPLQIKKVGWFVDVYLNTGSGWKKILTDIDYTKSTTISDDGMGLIVNTDYTLPNDENLVGANAKIMARLRSGQNDSSDFYTSSAHSTGVYAATDDSDDAFSITGNTTTPTSTSTVSLHISDPNSETVWHLNSDQKVEFSVSVTTTDQNGQSRDLSREEILHSYGENTLKTTMSLDNGEDGYPVVLSDKLKLKDALKAAGDSGTGGLVNVSIANDPMLITDQAVVELDLQKYSEQGELAAAISDIFKTKSGSLIAGLKDFFDDHMATVVFSSLALLAAIAAAIRALVPLGNLLAFSSLGEVMSNITTRIANFFGLLLFGLKKKRFQGIVYDSAALDPIPGARISLLRIEEAEKLGLQDTKNDNLANYQNSQAKYLQTVSTDSSGRFQLSLEPGVYKIIAKKSGYLFPSKQVLSRTFNPVENNYYGKVFRVNDYSSEQDLFFNIPLDQSDPSYVKSRTRSVLRVSILEQVLALLNYPLLIIGTLVSTLAVIADPSIFNNIILALYIPLWFLGVSSVFKLNSWGTVIDKEKNQPLELALVRAYALTPNENTKKYTKVQKYESDNDLTNQQSGELTNFRLGKLVRTVVTDQKGKYYLRLTPGVYNVNASKSNYQNFKPHRLKIFRGLDFVNLILALIPKSFQPKKNLTAVSENDDLKTPLKTFKVPAHVDLIRDL